MRRSGLEKVLPLPVPLGQTSPDVDGVEYTPEFLELDTMVNAYDAEGVGPLRKGERPFQWDVVAQSAQALLAQAPDLRVALWLLRAYMHQRGVAGLVEGLGRLAELLALPEADLFPRPQAGEPAREAHAISLAWLGSAAVLHQLRTAPLAPELALSCADIRADEGRALALDEGTRTALAAQLQAGVAHMEQIANTLQQDGAYLAFNSSPLRDEMAFALKALRSKDIPQPAPAASRPAQASASAPSSGHSLQRREEVQQSLAALISYFREYEPGHPAPLLLQRVQRMLGASFEELMNELYADAKQMIARIEKPQNL